jgi:hypothetical protein
VRFVQVDPVVDADSADALYSASLSLSDAARVLGANASKVSDASEAVARKCRERARRSVCAMCTFLDVAMGALPDYAALEEFATLPNPPAAASGWGASSKIVVKKVKEALSGSMNMISSLLLNKRTTFPAASKPVKQVPAAPKQVSGDQPDVTDVINPLYAHHQAPQVDASRASPPGSPLVQTDPVDHWFPPADAEPPAPRMRALRRQTGMRANGIDESIVRCTSTVMPEDGVTNADGGRLPPNSRRFQHNPGDPNNPIDPKGDPSYKTTPADVRCAIRVLDCAMLPLPAPPLPLSSTWSERLPHVDAADSVFVLYKRLPTPAAAAAVAADELDHIQAVLGDYLDCHRLPSPAPYTVRCTPYAHAIRLDDDAPEDGFLVLHLVFADTLIESPRFPDLTWLPALPPPSDFQRWLDDHKNPDEGIVAPNPGGKGIDLQYNPFRIVELMPVYVKPSSPAARKAALDAWTAKMKIWFAAMKAYDDRFTASGTGTWKSDESWTPDDKNFLTPLLRYMPIDFNAAGWLDKTVQKNTAPLLLNRCAPTSATTPAT